MLSDYYCSLYDPPAPETGFTNIHPRPQVMREKKSVEAEESSKADQMEALAAEARLESLRRLGRQVFFIRPSRPSQDICHR